MINCNELVNSYVQWLKQRIKVEEVNGVCEITTPFLDRRNDHLQIYIKRKETGYLLTDDGYTLSDLELSGLDINSEKRKQILQTILNGFGVKRTGDELIVETREDNFPQKKHNLIQAILAINDMFVLTRPAIASLFKEDVERYLKTKEIRYTPAVHFIGKSGFGHYFDFVIPASVSKPERILRTINHPNKQNITSLIFSWTDTKGIRSSNSTAYGVLNDTEQSISPDLHGALSEYDLKAIPWSKRDEFVEELAA